MNPDCLRVQARGEERVSVGLHHARAVLWGFEGIPGETDWHGVRVAHPPVTVAHAGQAEFRELVRGWVAVMVDFTLEDVDGLFNADAVDGLIEVDADAGARAGRSGCTLGIHAGVEGLNVGDSKAFVDGLGDTGDGLWRGTPAGGQGCGEAEGEAGHEESSGRVARLTLGGSSAG